MDNEAENLNSSTEETENTDSSTGESEQEENSQEQYTEREKQYYARIKDLESKLKTKDSEPQKKETKSDDFGYDVKAYLKSSGIKADEFDFVRKELKNFSGSVDDLIENEYFQNKLEKERKLKETADAIPKSKRSGAPATDSVDYWLSKPFEEVPQNMRNKVVTARMEQEKKGVRFYNS